MRKMWPVLAALVVLTSACRLETNLIMNVNDDGSGTLTTELGLDQEMQDALASFGGGGDDFLSGLEFGDATPTETRTEGDMTYYGATQDFASIDELRDFLDSNQDQADFEEFRLEVDESGARLVARTGPLDAQGGLDDGSLPFDPSTITDDFFSANIFAKLPGNVTTHNADEVMADGSLRWSISLTDPIDIQAESSFGGGGVPWVPIGIAAVVVLGVGAFLVARNRGDATASAALASTPAPPAPGDFSDPAARAIGGATETAATADLPPEFPPQGGVGT